MLALLTDLTTTLAQDLKDEYIPFLAVGGGLLIALIAVIGSFVRSITVGRAREQSRREIAAYVAEGSMSAEDGAKLLTAGRPAWETGQSWAGHSGFAPRKRC